MRKGSLDSCEGENLDGRLSRELDCDEVRLRSIDSLALIVPTGAKYC
jgi:hypothetical protein